jgi:hypothetical protein
MAEDRIKEIQKQIIAKLETGEDVSELTQELAQERAKVTAQAEVEGLGKIAAERQAHRDKAAKVQEKVKLQGEAIDTFLAKRDSITEALAPILEQAKELPELQGQCYSYHDSFQFGVDIRQLPQGYLPSNFSCPRLIMASGKVESYDIAAMALFHLRTGLGFLSNLTKGEMTAPEKPPGEFDGDLEPEKIEVDTICRVCQHPEHEAIDKALQSRRSLRDIETEFNVPRSTLSRHKNRCLNLGAVRVVKVDPESPTDSANQTFFRG